MRGKKAKAIRRIMRGVYTELIRTGNPLSKVPFKRMCNQAKKRFSVKGEKFKEKVR